MRRGETVAIAAGLALVASYLALVIFASAWLNAQGWFGASSNLIQHYSGPGLFAGLAMAAWTRWNGRCGVDRCIRRGEHPVRGTRRKVCHHHHRLPDHEAVYDRFRVVDGLAWGESHGRQAADLFERGVLK